MSGRKSLLERWVERRFGGYLHQLNAVRTDRPLRLQQPRSTAVVGGGLAGLTAACLLAERGFRVALFERNDYLGGKVGSWPVSLEGGFRTRVEHGFHAFFRQYHNLRRFLSALGVQQRLIPIEDYRIDTLTRGSTSFQGIRTTPVLNMLSMARKGVYRLGEVARNPASRRLLDLLTYDPEKTFARYDHTSFREFAEAIGLPPSLRIVFTTFARAFFAESHHMSMAEMIKSFHFYFLSNDLGLIYDVLDDDFELTLLAPARRFLEKRGAEIHTGCPVERLQRADSGFAVADRVFDALVLATDVRAARGIAAASPFLAAEDPVLHRRLASLQPSRPYAVLRLWLDRPLPRTVPFFLFTDRVRVLDSISSYHHLEASSAAWARETGGGIFELHSYALPDDLTEPGSVRTQLLEELYLYMPELKPARVLHEYLQVRDDFTAFHTGLHAERPEPRTGIPGLVLAADWVKIPCPAMLMEAAATSALLAANELLEAEGLRQEPVYSVPLRGLFARGPRGPGCRESGFQPQ